LQRNAAAFDFKLWKIAAILPFIPLKPDRRKASMTRHLSSDWEVELAVVIWKKASYVAKENALDFVAGFALHNDYSERTFQLERGGQWAKGKSADTFAPLGPFLATPDEIPNVNNLKMWLKVNGTLRQNGSTSNMIFDVATLVSYVSQFMRFCPET
jgi:2,4-didehydro-3-deoxy-L-rhamnonate hydrolase